MEAEDIVLQNMSVKNTEGPDIYRTMIKKSIFGYACCSLRYDANKQMTDIIITESNKSFIRLFGISATEVEGISIYGLLPGLDASKDKFQKCISEALGKKKTKLFRHFVESKNRWLQIQVIPAGLYHMVMLVNDCSNEIHNSERVELEKALNARNLPISPNKQEVNVRTRTNFLDLQTGLYNGIYFGEELKQNDYSENYPLSIIMTGIHGLKLINDTYGPIYGDRLTLAFVSILKKRCRSDDMIARVGGDEFAILLPKTNQIQAEKIVNRIREAIMNTSVGKLKLSVSFACKTKHAGDEELEEIGRQAKEELNRLQSTQGKEYISYLIKTIAESFYEKCPLEQLHGEKVSMICKNIGMIMGMGTDDINELGQIGRFHDIGKFLVSEKVINKPGTLNDEEWEEMKRHPVTGCKLLLSSEEYSGLAPYILAHHERPDGKGYPYGLTEEKIPLKSRILSVAEAFDAMTGGYYNKKSLSISEAVSELRSQIGSRYDGEIVKAFIEAVLKED